MGEENASPAEGVLYILIMESILNWKRSEHRRIGMSFKLDTGSCDQKASFPN